jgi:hypothetical protein
MGEEVMITEVATGVLVAKIRGVNPVSILAINRMHR